MQQLADFCEDFNLDLTQFDYVLVEGRVKCKGCTQIWPERISDSPLVKSSILVINGAGEIDLISQFKFEKGEALIVEFDSIEKAFPYIANYFLFYRLEGEFTGYVELGARNIPIPESTR